MSGSARSSRSGASARNVPIYRCPRACGSETPYGADATRGAVRSCIRRAHAVHGERDVIRRRVIHSRKSSGGRWDGLERDGKAEALQATNEASLDVVALMLVEVLRPQLVVGFPSGEHMVDGDQHRVADGDHRPTFAPARGDAAELGCQVA